MHLHVVFTYQATFYSQIFSQHIFRLNFQTYCIRSTQDSEPVKDAKKCPIINQSENKMPTSSQSHVTDLISFLTHIWHAQLEWFHYLQYLCQDRCFRQPWTKMEKDHVSQMGETEIKWQSWAELVPWTLWKLTFNFPFHSKRFRPFRAIFIDKKQFLRAAAMWHFQSMTRTKDPNLDSGPHLPSSRLRWFICSPYGTSAGARLLIIG